MDARATKELVTDEQILDATLRQLTLTGVRRTTADDIARQAGVNRATLYRRLGAKEEIVAAAFLREAAKFLAQLQNRVPDVPPPGKRGFSPEANVVAFFTTTVTMCRENQLLARMLEVDQAETLASLTIGAGDVLELAAGVLTERLQALREWEGRKPLDDYELQALSITLARLTQSLVLNRDAPPALNSPRDFERYARAVIVPMVLGR